MKKAFFSILLIIASAMILPLKFYAQDEARDEIKIYLGEPQIIPIDNPTRIVIGNPAIADVANVSKKEVTLNPKSAGVTTLVIWDNSGELSYRVRVFSENMEEIKRRVDSMLGPLNFHDVYTKAAEEEGKIMLLGKVKTAQDRERVNTALAPLKDKIVDVIAIEEDQTGVDIDVQVLELSKQASTTLGIQWPNSLNLATDGNADGNTWYFNTAELWGNDMVTWKNIWKIKYWSRTNFRWTLDALVRDGKARVLSRPKLSCQSGKEAELWVGGEKPIFALWEGEGGSSGAKIEYKEYGMKLTIKPTVTEDKRIKLALKTDISELEEAETLGTTTSTYAKAYPLTRRVATTEIYSDNGETIAIGGLIKQRTDETVIKTPILGDIPILGHLFRHKTLTHGVDEGGQGDIELFITLTSTIKGEKLYAADGRVQNNGGIGAELSRGNKITRSGPAQNYISLVQKLILDNLTYPKTAREAGFKGVVTLMLRLSYTGDLQDVSVKSSSGYKILDDNAVNIARKITPYPPFPTDMNQTELSIDVPISYRLD